MNQIRESLYLFFLLLSFGVFGQKTITGTVTDANGMPLPSVNVILQGTDNGVVTDFDGNYQIEGVYPEDYLVFSFIGMEQQSFLVGEQTTIDVVLQDGANNLDEVVLVAYGTATKRDLTGAVSTMSSEDMETFPATDVNQAIQGKLSGVQVTQNSGSPGSAMSINIRGVASFGSNDPLYVVDGFPTQDISFLNPNDIESISVLKDASAAAIYGVRANAGVVIIKTKSGVSEKVVVSLDNFVSIQTVPQQIDMLDAPTFARFAMETGQDQGVNTLEEWNNPSNLRTVNWQDYAFDTGVKNVHNISIRGGSDRSKTAFSLGMVNDDGIVVSAKYKRYNIGLNTDYKIAEGLKFRGSIKYAYAETYNNLAAGFYGFARIFDNVPYLNNSGIAAPYDDNGNYGVFTDSQLISSSTNVIANALLYDNDNNSTTLLTNMALDYEFLDGFKITGKFGYRNNGYSGSSFVPTYFRSANDQNANASYSVNQSKTNQYIGELLLNYKRVFDKHSLDILLGSSAQKELYENIATTGQGFLNNSIRDLSSANEIINYSGTNGTATFASTFARLNYVFDQKYSFTATVRRDGVGNKFASDNLYGVFPSVAGAWNLDQESFMDNSVFDLLKLRGSWGETGNSQGIEAFRYMATYTSGATQENSGYVFGGSPVTGLSLASLANPDLTWESQIQTNIGLDFELFDSKFYGTIDYFNKSAKDFLLDQTIPAQNGFTTMAVNAGNVENKGIEVLLGYRKSEGDFTWDLSGNISVIENEITDLGNQEFVTYPSNFTPSFNTSWSGFTRSYVGGNVGAFYGYRANGIFQSQEEIDQLNAGAPDGEYQPAYGLNPIAPGDRRFEDINGDGEITAEDREIIGSPIPDLYGGLNFNAAYKNFDFQLAIYGSYGNDILNFIKSQNESLGAYGYNSVYTNVSQEYYNNRWTPTNPSNTYARAVIEDTNRNGRISDYFVEDGSFLKLRNIKLGYNLPLSILERFSASRANLYISGQNLITLTSYSGLDPEIGTATDIDGNGGVQTRGIDFGSYPNSPTITLGLNLQF
ncbi:TonB-linked outer membrane protein, SusC/RagA family [Zunongwangia mangrovi]|uniref:TonB-linked outer membrane protein, SusC/RagA family n=1 Tax=Zunongwangia mangrovi TaxID=1334022 RepID=A0A1I1EAR2_9FLAO|nr:TonB-dependent receptor [Zunongwangia mangrovi]SFB84224.1 TonB-linked outer membrane protein, SusC/RagA family [Zunongwangia mangrovi]